MGRYLGYIGKDFKAIMQQEWQERIKQANQKIQANPQDAIAEELQAPPTSRKVRYVVSEEITGNETASILGAAIGKPDLKWIIISNEQMLSDLEAVEMNPQIAKGLVEMYASQHSGLLEEDYHLNKPSIMGKVKMTDFAKEFAAAF